LGKISSSVSGVPSQIYSFVAGFYTTRAPPLVSQSSSGPVAANHDPVGPPCSARGLHASGRFPPWVARVGHVPPSRLRSVLSGVLWWLVVQGYFQGWRVDLSGDRIPPRRWLCCLSVFCSVCKF
jgi:hypothetical protein